MPAQWGAGIGNALSRVPKLAVYLLGFVPAAVLVYRGFNDQLGAEPFRELENVLGLWALRFLIASLAVTPLRLLTGINLLVHRRALGLLAFYYAALHLTSYLWLDQGLFWPAIWADIVKRPFITVGMAVFVILVPLAATSNNLAVRKMGARAWARQHRIVYLAAIGGAVHFIRLVKAWPPEPLIYAAIVLALLAFRLLPSSRRRKRPRRSPAVQA